MQAGLVALALVYPAFGTPKLHATLGPFTLLAALPAPGPPPAKTTRPVAKPVARITPAKLEAPRMIPRRVEFASARETPPEVNASGPALGPLFDAGVLGGVPDGSPNGLLTAPSVRIGGDVMQAKRLDATIPVYPAEALKKRVMGVVSVRAIISKEGRIVDVEVVSGDPLLVPSALDAIAQFRYEPTLLNGMPAEVDTTIDVVFQIVFPPAYQKKKHHAEG